ncbi:MAG: ATP-grasp domain-containing protein [Marinilabiliaceae bacterium]|nr:ATP-grasp domain-containing protein [Marinilabiliaceae bacterium]
MSKTILIFGAGLNQYNLIQAAKNLGISSIVLDPNPVAPGKNIADYFYHVAGADYEMTKQIALKHHVNGLATTQMEKPLRLMAQLAQELNLLFHSKEVVERSLDKWLMKQAFAHNGVPCAKGYLLKNQNEVDKSICDKVGYPLIMKPKDATSSQGVFKVDCYEQVIKNREKTSYYSQNGEIILEEYLPGNEYSVESITYHGNTTIIQHTEKFITPFPYTVEMGHLQPAHLNIHQKNQIDRVVKAAINAIGIDNSASHAEIKLTPDGPKMVEIGARGGGDFISSNLTLASTGVNMDEAIINVALDEKPQVYQRLNQFSFIKYFELPVGKKIIKIEDYSTLFSYKNLVFANIAIKPGEKVEQITESKKRPGFVIVKGKNRSQVLNLAKDYSQNIISRIKMDE